MANSDLFHAISLFFFGSQPGAVFSDICVNSGVFHICVNYHVFFSNTLVHGGEMF